MPVTFENDNDIVVYALECVTAHAKRTHHIFVAQCVWWLASIIGLEQALVSHINKLQGHKDTTLQEQPPWEVSATPRDLGEDQRIHQVLDNTEQYLKKSRRLREIAELKISGRTTTGQINPIKKTKKSLRISKERFRNVAFQKEKDSSKTEGIDVNEVSRRKAAGECLRCAWPSGRKGNHKVKDCRRSIKSDKGTAGFPKEGWVTKSSAESDSKDSSDSEINTDQDLRPYTPIVLSKVLVDRCCTPVTTNTTAVHNISNCIESKSKTGWGHNARQDPCPFDLGGCHIIKSAAAALCFQWIGQALDLPNRVVISISPAKGKHHMDLPFHVPLHC